MQTLKRTIDEVAQSVPTDAESAGSNARAVFLSVWNMDCPHCDDWLRRGLLEIPGVLKVDIFRDRGVVIVLHNPELVSAGHLVQRVEEIGRRVHCYYGAEVIGESPARQA